MKSQSLMILIYVFLRIRVSLQSETPDKLEYHLCPADLRELYRIHEQNLTDDVDDEDVKETTIHLPVSGQVACTGFGPVIQKLISLFNMKPDDPEKVNTQFYFSSRRHPKRVQVFPGEQFGLEWVDFKPNRKTVMIVHGFMSHSNASWVNEMTEALLKWGDVNVIAVDWSGGASTWKYLRAVANTRRVGTDITIFFNQLIRETGANLKDFHFIGHSLGAHISSYASCRLGKVARITGLDPAQPCFAEATDLDRLDPTDADFVDVIHTNGDLLIKIGFGLPDPIGHADFYPNGGLQQPGCYTGAQSFWAKWNIYQMVQQAICSHGRSYILFTESLINKNCSFQAYSWDFSYEGVNTSLTSTCDRRGTCSEMGIKAVGEKDSIKAVGRYILLTTDKEPYCALPKESRFSILDPTLGRLRDVFSRFLPSTTTIKINAKTNTNETKDSTIEETTTKRSWFSRWFG